MSDTMLETVEAYLLAKPMSATVFGRDVLGDPCAVFDMRAGRELKPSTRQRIVDYIIKNPVEVK